MYIVFFLSIFSPKAQELIYNGGFEEKYSCPTGNDLNDGQLEKTKGWYQPTWGTSDYFNRCATQIVGIPNNFWGYQEAFNGDGYIGLVPACWFSTGDYCGFEYVQQKLKMPLKPCYKYNFSMYVVLGNASTHAIKGLGASFTTYAINESSDQVINLTPQVENTLEVISDTTNWYKIEGNFVANGFERYVSIGYFHSKVTDDTLYLQNILGFQSFAPYYYIDNVSLLEVGKVSGDCQSERVPFPNIITSNDDGVNDFIDISEFMEIVSEVLILNRWGNTVAVLNKEHPVWNGGDCVEGVYFYHMKFSDESDIDQQTGFIHLLRSTQ